MDEQIGHQPPGGDVFLRRLVAAAFFGVALITAAYGAYFALLRGPGVNDMLRDFGARPGAIVEFQYRTLGFRWRARPWRSSPASARGRTHDH